MDPTHVLQVSTDNSACLPAQLVTPEPTAHMQLNIRFLAPLVSTVRHRPSSQLSAQLEPSEEVSVSPLILSVLNAQVEVSALSLVHLLQLASVTPVTFVLLELQSPDLLMRPPRVELSVPLEVSVRRALLQSNHAMEATSMSLLDSRPSMIALNVPEVNTAKELVELLPSETVPA